MGIRFQIQQNTILRILYGTLSIVVVALSLVVYYHLNDRMPNTNSSITESSELHSSAALNSIDSNGASENAASLQNPSSLTSAQSTDSFSAGSLSSDSRSKSSGSSWSSSISQLFSQIASGSDFSWQPVDPNNGDEKAVQVDFGIKDFSETPYLKKFDMFSSTWSWQNLNGGSDFFSEQVLGTIPSIAKLRPESIRTDLFMGYYGIGWMIGSSTSLKGTTAAEFRDVKTLTSLWKANGMRGNMVYFANPVYSGGGADGDRWRTTPDETKWNELCFNIAKYFKDNDFGVMTHEILNEPDFYSTTPQADGVFFRGSWQDYIDTYIAGATGIRAADKDAVIGGISAAYISKLEADGRYANFLTQVDEAGVPLDFISWHYYGQSGKFDGNASTGADLDTYIASARKGLSGNTGYSTIQQHLNEFNVTIQGTVYQTYAMTEAIFNVFQRLLSATDITRVSWASPLEQSNNKPVLSLIDPLTFKRYPSFYAMWMYARLPVERVQTGNLKSGIKVLAARDEGRASIILYDAANQQQEVNLFFDGINMKKYDVTVYCIDKNKPNYNLTSDEPIILYEYKGQTADNVNYQVTVPKEGVIYIEINNSAKGASLDYKSGYSDHVVRKEYWYPQRGDGYAFADVNLNSMSACVGAGSANEGLGSACSVTLEDMKDETVSIQYESVGKPSKKSSASMLGIKVDYEVSGKYVKSVYFYLNNINGSASIPLGTEKAPDEMISMGAGKGSYSVPLNQYAPSGWNGRVQICYLVNNIGINNGAVFYIR